MTSLLAESENEEPAFATEYREKRLHVKTLGHDEMFIKMYRQTVVVKHVHREKCGKAVALLTPENDISQEPLRGFKEFLDLSRAKSRGEKFFFGLTEKDF
jgi:hypothetical protein